MVVMSTTFLLFFGRLANKPPTECCCRTQRLVEWAEKYLAFCFNLALLMRFENMVTDHNANRHVNMRLAVKEKVGSLGD